MPRSGVATQSEGSLTADIARGSNGIHILDGEVLRNDLRSVVIPRLQKIDPRSAHPIHQPVLLSNSPRPTSCQHVLQRLRLSNAHKRIAQDSLDQFESPKTNLPIIFDPVAKVLSEGRPALAPSSGKAVSFRLYNPPVPESPNPRLDRVLNRLRLYEHPLLTFFARPKGEAVEGIIQFKDETSPSTPTTSNSIPATSTTRNSSAASSANSTIPSTPTS